jgi:hypothetical protein
MIVRNGPTAEFMHQVVMKATRVVIQTTHYGALNCDEVSTIDNQSWLSIHCYVVENWVRILNLISLDKVVATLQVHGSDNLIKVIMEALMIGGSLQQN